MNEPRTQDIFDAIWRRKAAFLLVFALALGLSYTVLIIIDFVPEPPQDTTADAGEAETEEAEGGVGSPTIHNEAGPAEEGAASAPKAAEDAGEGTDGVRNAAAALPQTILIEALDKEVPVNNPTSRVVADLDAALLTGAVRHPDSATFTNEGNIFILGHSSYLPNVFNQNFQAFNGIQNLKWGDTIRLRSADTEYVYRVEKVYQAKASEVTVPIADTGPRLTLATCNSFASKDDRYIVESKLVDTRPL